jgi:hypothetical protein
VDDRLRGRARALGGDLHLRDLRARRGGRERDGGGDGLVVGDPRISEEFGAERVAIYAREFHVYAVEWTPEHVAFSIDGEHVKRVGQSPSYPMQLMLGFYEFPEDDAWDRTITGAYPKEFVVDYVRGYRRVPG